MSSTTEPRARKKRSNRRSATAHGSTDESSVRHFPIVGVGASAGGLQALKDLFAAVPENPSVAFVVIQHLDPTRESLASEILGRHAKIHVVEVHDQPRVRPNCVYIIPPGKYLSVVAGELVLSEPDKPRGSRMAIDFFLRSLAEDQGERAVAVILSGTGTDGALGAMAVKESGGLVIAQEPATAEHDGMPRRAIETGAVDLVVAPPKIWDALFAYASFAAAGAAEDAKRQAEEPEQMLRALRALRVRGKRDFRAYKEATLVRRLRRRAALQRKSFSEYVESLEHDSGELDQLARDLLINVTRFFRDREAWEDLTACAIEPIVTRTDNGEPIRVWVPGSATGEEAYTVGILLMEQLRQAKKTCPLQIFATDVASHALDIARAGRYPQSIEADLAPELLRRYFAVVPGEERYRVGKALRESIVFSGQDLLTDPPFSRLDLVCCRNVLIYLKTDVQQKVVSLFHFALAESGFLFLGSAETVGSLDDTFQTLSKRWRIFRRIGPTQHDRVEFPVTAGPSRRALPNPIASASPQIAQLAERSLLEWLAPSAVLINRKWRILYISGEVDAYLSRIAGAPSDDLLDNLRKGLGVKLRGAMQAALDQRHAVTVSARVQRDGRYFPVSVVVQPLPAAGEDIDHLLILFREGGSAVVRAEPPGDATAVAADRSEEGDRGLIRQLEDELATMRGDLRSTIEQLESSNEEYRASNEEVMSINEELRSTNEELETSKEELQSLNEELHTVNDQLATKVAELETKNADLENLQEATDIATICVDTNLRVRWFTPAIAQVIRLQQHDKGRSIADFSNDFVVDDLVQIAGQVLRKLTPSEGEVECTDDRIFMRRVTPYRTEDHRIGGVVATFIDISQRKRSEQAVRDAKELADRIIETVDHPMLVLDADLKVQRANAAYYRNFKTDRGKILGMPLPELGGGVWDTPELRTRLAIVLPDGEGFDGLEMAEDFEGIGRRAMLLSARRIDDMQLILLVLEDVTERKRGEEALRVGEQRLRRVIENEAVGVVFFDTQGTVFDANAKFLQMTGLSRRDIEDRTVTWQNITPSEYVAATIEHLRKLETTGRFGPYEKEYRRKDGSRCWMMFAGASLGDGTIVEFCIDIASRKRAEHALVDADRRKDEFLATLAHELRNPLAPITTAVQVLRASSDDAPTRERMYAMMERQLSHLVRLVDDLLDVARVSRGFIELRMEPVDVAGILRTAVETSSPRIEASGRKLSVTLPGESLTVNGDPIRLSQVLVNLLNNAANYSSRNGEIRLGARRDDDHAVITVRDDGVGIAADMLPKVFEMFVQVDRSRTGGLGIGLTLARSLVQLHGGTLEAFSEGLGKGSEFVVRLPLHRGSAAKTDADRPALTDIAVRRVLVVDDNRDAADSLGMMLGTFGAEVEIAYDGVEALSLADTFRPELVLLDLGMPKMDGYEVARRFRERTGACTLVAVTGWGQDADRQKTKDAGFSHHLTKPVAVDQLLELLGPAKPARRTNGPVVGRDGGHDAARGKTLQ